MNQFLVILRGVPASGKSTIAKKLRNFEGKIVWLKVDNFKDFFADDASIALEYVNGSAIATLNYLLEEGFSVVMEGVFQDTVAIDKAFEMGTNKNVNTVVYQLDCPFEVLKKRDKLRPGVPEGLRPAMDEQSLEKIFNKLRDNPYLHAKKLNTEEHSLEKCVELIRNDLHLLV